MDSKLYRWQEENKQIDLQENIIDNNIIQDEFQVIDEGVQEEPEVEQKRNRVKKNMPEDIGVFSMRQDMVRHGRYRYFDSKGASHKASRTSPSKKFMKPLLETLKAIDEKLAQKVNPNEAEDIQKLFKKAGIACETYIDNRPNPWTTEGKARKQMVQDFYAQIKKESLMFEARVSTFKDNPNAFKENETWLDILKNVRTTTYEDGQNGVNITIGGASTSEVYIIEKNGVKKYFKQNEKVLGTDPLKLIDQGIQTIKDTTDEFLKGQYFVSDKKDMKEKSEHRVEMVKAVKDAIEGLAKDPEYKIGVNDLFQHNREGESILLKLYSFSQGKPGLEKVFSSITDDFVVYDTSTKVLKDKIKQLEGKPEWKETRDELLAELEKQERNYKESDYVFLSDFLTKVRKNWFSNDIATDNAKIKENEELSKRNVATSRMAKLLGLSDLIAKSEMAQITVNGKTMKGTIMEDAGGDTIPGTNTQCIREGKKLKYSPEAIKQLFNLQIFDIICGQIDRHNGNYYVQTQNAGNKVYITGVKGIDNDMSFGCLNYETIKASNAYNRMKNIEYNGSLVIPLIDHKLAMKIKALTPEIINYEMVDILSREERNALINRIEGIKNAIDRQLALEESYRAQGQNFTSKFVIEDDNNKDAWEKAAEEYIQKIQEREKKAGDVAIKAVEATTYLYGDLL